MPKKSARTSRQQTQNTCTPSWQGITDHLQQFILTFLSPIEALPGISTSKDNLNDCGPHIIQRLRDENLSYTIVSIGVRYTLAMRQDGTLFDWGYNRHYVDQNTPQRIPQEHFQGKTIQSIHTGRKHTIAQCADGMLIAWGQNGFGQLGLGHTEHQNTPQLISQEQFQSKAIQSIHAGSHHTLIRCSDDSLFAWGCNTYAQLGLGHTNHQNTPKLISNNNFQGKDIQTIHAGGEHTLVRCTDDSLFAWGWNNWGQLGIGHTHNQDTPQHIPNDHFQEKGIQVIHLGWNCTLTLCADGTLFAWGDNNNGQLGLGHTNDQNTPQRIDSSHFQGKTIQSIHTGDYHTLTRCTDDSLFAWGYNNNGQLGLGHTNDQNTPQLIDPNHFQGKAIQFIHPGENHTLALSTDGSLFAWGDNDHGQLGLGHTNDQNTPQLIDSSHFQGKTIQSIHTGEHHNLALCSDGTLFSWGKNNKGQLGLGHTNHQLTPTQLPGPLERAFRTGHQRLNSTSFFSNKAVDPTTRFLSGCVLHPIETDKSRTKSTTTSMANQ